MCVNGVRVLHNLMDEHLHRQNMKLFQHFLVNIYRDVIILMSFYFIKEIDRDINRDINRLSHKQYLTIPGWLSVGPVYQFQNEKYINCLHFD